MSTIDIETEITNLRDQAGRTIADYRGRVDAVNADPGRTAEWKKATNTTDYADTKAKLEDLQKRELAAIDAAIDKRMHRLVGTTSPLTGSDVISKRDADDRVSRLKDATEAKALMQRALKSGDDILAKAVLEDALRDNDTATVAEYTAKHSAAGQTIAELQGIGQLRSADANFRRGMLYQAISQP